ncbi:endoglucanase II [Coprinopsis marcescibilis]|uniref:AA9 family lytic polysaccharide monooxygenase n=1 Tax=Coprinopsis marcescibilis TaxID=230819 RepID=A0A5C3KKJ5_COPMA|nr:endoglucanase II [Coprinopsis marcescibilis]
MKNLTALATLAVLFSSAAAHTIFQELHVNGVSQGHTVGIRVPTYDGPITDVSSNDIICNGGINPYRQPLSTKIIDVPAGAEVTAEYHHTLNGADPKDNSDPIDASHKGPVMAYLAKVPSAVQRDVTGLKWFKIYHDGLNSGVWGVDKLIKNKGKVSFTIPKCIENGEYLLRVELIALHGAQSYPGAQFYMECAQIKISGGGSTTPYPTVSFPGAYKGTDAGVKVNIYSGLSSYTIPGPEVFTCGADSGPAPTANPPVVIAPPASTSVPPVVVPSQPPSQGTVPQWGQCGGSGYSGPSECISPYKCTKTNEWYSQCL